MAGSRPKQHLLGRRPDFPDNAVLPAAGRSPSISSLFLFSKMHDLFTLFSFIVCLAPLEWGLRAGGRVGG